MTIDEVANQLFKERPSTVLYHYTSLSSLPPIINSKSVFATDVHFLNDTGELVHTDGLLRQAMAQNPGTEKTARLHEQFRGWLRHRLPMGHAIFASCFSARGNLLSQWRGYCESAKGISLGFDPNYLRKAAEVNGYSMGQCVYDTRAQLEVAGAILRAVEELAETMGESTKHHSDNSYHEVFATVEPALLRIAALLKNPAFQEEDEWRAVSAVVTNYVEAPLEYREGRSTLVPYLRLALPLRSAGAVDLDHVIIGPTPHVNNAMTAVVQFLSKAGASPRNGVSYCNIPYRDW
jgi:hypothetical protein